MSRPPSPESTLWNDPRWMIVGVLLFFAAGIWALCAYLDERQAQQAGGKEGHFEMVVELDPLPYAQEPFQSQEGMPTPERQGKPMPTPVFDILVSQERNKKSS